MVMWIIFAAAIFTSLYAAVGADQLVKDGLSLLPGGRWGMVIGMQLIWIVMGCFLDPIGIMILTAPLFFPIIVQLGFDPVWFGVLFVVNMEMAFLTPPFGFNLFRSEEHTSELQSLMRISYAVFCLTKKKN